MFKKFLSAFLCAILVVSVTGCADSSTSGDRLSGNKWESSDKTLLSLEDDGSFKWYKSSSDRKDNYYTGTYKVMNGQSAIDYLSEEHGLDKTGQENALAQYAVSADEYYAVVLDNEERIVNGEDTLKEKNSAVYYGYYKDKYETLTLYSIDNRTEYSFKLF